MSSESKREIQPLPTHPKLERKETLSLEEVLPFVKFSEKGTSKKVYNGDIIKMDSLRYQLFSTKGVECVKCGLKGSFFAKEKNPKDKSYHLNLYGVKDGIEIMLTKDHIQPKSLGGSNDLSNLQPMCKICNELKGNETT